MNYISLKKYKNAVIYVRRDPESDCRASPAAQEECCRRYCKNRRLQILQVVRVTCGDEDSLEHLMALAASLPPETDLLVASSFTDYSHLLRYLGLVCLLYMGRGIELYSEDLPGPIRKHLPFIGPAEYRASDKWKQLPLEAAIRSLKEYRRSAQSGSTK